MTCLLFQDSLVDLFAYVYDLVNGFILDLPFVLAFFST